MSYIFEKYHTASGQLTLSLTFRNKQAHKHDDREEDKTTDNISLRLIRTIVGGGKGPHWFDIGFTGSHWSPLGQFGTIWYNMVQFSAIWYNLVQSRTIWYNLVQSGGI